MHFNLQKHTILVSLAGSRAYGINTEDSDVDFKGVAISPKEIRNSVYKSFEFADKKESTSFVLDLMNPSLKETAQRVGYEGSIYELRKFLKLAADCNPNILDVLFSDDTDIIYASDVGKTLRLNRDLFLSKKALYTFQGYAHSQLKRIESHKKWLLNPYEEKPSRKEFDLPEISQIPTEQRNLIFQDIQSVIDSWEIDFGDMFESEKIKIQNQISEKLIQLSLGKEEIWKIALSRAYSYFSEDLKAILLSERRYLEAMNNWKKFQEWKTGRNEKRAELERKFGYDTKHAAHLIRLLLSCKELMEAGTLSVKRKDADYIRSIRSGSLSYEQLMEATSVLSKEIAMASDKSSLPKYPNLDKIDSLYKEMLDRFDKFNY